MSNLLGIIKDNNFSSDENLSTQGRIQGFRKGGGEQKNIEVTVHVVVQSTGRRPVDTTPWASPGGGLEGGDPPPEVWKKLK